MSLPRVLLIGHGYLGSNLAQTLGYKGFALAAVNRAVQENDTYPVLAGDVALLESVEALRDQLPFSRPDAIVHCASSGRGGAEAYRAVFVDGVANLQAVFPDIPVLMTSSTSVYGQTDGSVVNERSPTSPERETSRLLCEAEERVRAGGGIALRLAGIYGPGRSVHLERILDGSATIESGEPSRYLNQIHRDDATGAIVHLLRQGVAAHSGSIFNVSDDSPLTQRQCYESMADFFDLPIPPEAPPDKNRKRAWTNKIVDNSALHATGWQPAYPSFIDALHKDERLVPSIRRQIAQRQPPE
ncbi:MAG: NAD-dependent epimerase/dehydratase family protein [Verrucomicrobiales bacterium]